MPWRKDWINPDDWAGKDGLRAVLERRAYEVWISEIMLQQTRVSVVIEYWNRWMERWPTIQDLSAASADEVLSAWRGLGYYSRATRIHQAAKLVVQDSNMRSLLPDGVAELEAKVPGVGRYTAGAISAIVFGHATPMVDGNVMRVLSRQLGIFGNIKANKSVTDAIWTAAEALVRAVAQDAHKTTAPDCDPQLSDRPGRWGQALMELGSTICTPKPNCLECPITSTCRAYGEGLLIADGQSHTSGFDAANVVDIEDLCQLCEPFEDATIPEGTNNPSRLGQTSRPSKASSRAVENGKRISTQVPSPDALEVIVGHARRFPVKIVKAAVREEECLVCAIVRSDGQYLLHRRPNKGLLAGLWELPSYTLPAAKKSTKHSRKRDAETYVAGLIHVGPEKSRRRQIHLKHSSELGTVPWQFSHLKLTMHVHLFTLDLLEGGPAISPPGQPHRWAPDHEIEVESMGTGMRKCWALVKGRSIS